MAFLNFFLQIIFKKLFFIEKALFLHQVLNTAILILHFNTEISLNQLFNTKNLFIILVKPVNTK
ncbi:MAG: hypothetical protein RIR11_3378 [Bacteroidota bacterium]